jgi:glycosyltransferase involved in cell wall biosynthesis
MTPPILAIVVPAYHAEPTLHGTLARLPRDELPPFRVLVVDDGSGDGTADLARRSGHELGLDLEVLVHPQNRGYGGAQKTGFRRSLELGCRVHALIHADGQYAPEELPRVIAPLVADEADVCVGSRILTGQAVRQGMPLARYLGNRSLTWLENRVFGLSFAEYHSGYMAYATSALTRIPFEALTDRFHFDGEMLLAAGKLGLRVRELPVSTHFGDESSSLAPLPYLREIGGVLVRYLRRGYPFQR